MLKKIALSTALAASALTALPAAAEAQSRYGYSSRYDNGYYNQRLRSRYDGYDSVTTGAMPTGATTTSATAIITARAARTARPARSSARSPAACSAARSPAAATADGTARSSAPAPAPSPAARSTASDCRYATKHEDFPR